MTIEEKRELSGYIIDLLHRTCMHHFLWFSEVKHQLGEDVAYNSLFEVFDKSLKIQLKKTGKVLGFDLDEEGFPEPLLKLDIDTLKKLVNTLSLNWIVNDGVWFQNLEFKYGLNDAKRCNDSCWSNFSPFEARAIKRIIGLSENPGLDGLKKALQSRIYSNINTQSITEEKDNSFVFSMNKCWVQEKRKERKLQDYPCKSAGLVEYAYFAREIDKRIKTKCIGCPPDKHPDDWYCSWRFSID